MSTSIHLGPFTISLENGKLVIDTISSENQQEAEKQREIRLLESVRKFMKANGGFRKESEIYRKYQHGRVADAKRMLAVLGFKTFLVPSRGRPASVYVLLDSLDNFQRFISERGLSIITEVDP